jgi:hypothetical protein
MKLLTILHGHTSIKSLTLHVCHVNPCDKKEDCLINSLLHDSFISGLIISESVISNQLIQALTHLEFYDCQINNDDSLTHLTFSTEKYWLLAIAEMRQQFQNGKILYSQVFVVRIIL